MEQDFTTGLEFGRALERLRVHGDRLDAIEEAVSGIRAELTKARGYISRGGLLIALWTGGMLTNASTDSGAELLRTLLRTLFRM
jgi:hypothetical protein